jgi:hypothetical protein
MVLDLRQSFFATETEKRHSHSLVIQRSPQQVALKSDRTVKKLAGALRSHSTINPILLMMPRAKP